MATTQLSAPFFTASPRRSSSCSATTLRAASAKRRSNVLPAAAAAASLAPTATPRLRGLQVGRTRRTAPRAATLSQVVVSAADAFVPVLSINDLPKGSRQVVSASGKSALLFWYRDAVYAVEPRSPAEGAYSEGFLEARLTQDGCIECPSTKTTFDLKTGEIKAWYPDNPVLRALTPLETCRPMETFPVRMDPEQGIISVDFEASNLAAAGLSGSSTRPVTTGGAATSAERNNVYGIEPRVYVQDGETEVEDQETRAAGKTKEKLEPATVIASTVALAIVAVAGTAVAISKESIPGLVIFWVALLAPVGYYVFSKSDE